MDAVQRVEVRAHFHSLAAAVADKLNATYRSKDEPDDYYTLGSGIISGQGYALNIYNNGRLNVSGRYESPVDRRNRSVRDVQTSQERREGTPVDSMNCSASKSAEQIARDITRRILPGVREYTRRFAEQNNAKSVAAAKRDAAVAQLRGSFPGCKAYASERLTDYSTVWIDLSENESVLLRVNPGGNVTVDTLHLSLERAIKVVEALRA